MEEKYNCGIYQVRNLTNDCVYIGQSQRLNRRKVEHFSALKNNKHENSHLQNAYNKYGKENFVFEILLICEPTEITFYENAIKQLHNDNCYNIRPCSDSNKGFHFSEESMIRYRASRPDFHGENGQMYGKHHTDATKEKMRKPKSEDHKRKLSIAALHMTDDHKRKLSENRADIFGEKNPMWGADRSGEKNPMFGRTQSPEARKKMSDAHKKRKEEKDRLAKLNDESQD